MLARNSKSENNRLWISEKGDLRSELPANGASVMPTTNSSTVLEVQNISKAFRDRKSGEIRSVFSDVNFSVGRGSFTSIVGASGCGKSTVLNICAGLVQPDSGQVVIDSQTLSGINTDAAYITQNANLLPWMSVYQNVLLPLEIRKFPKDERDDRIHRWLDLVGLTEFAHYYPSQLSGGMQKRCSIARSLVYEPELILMDEPFGPLDAITRQVLQQEMLRLWEGSNNVVVFVTHDLNEALALSDQIIVMGTEPGRVMGIVDVPLSRPRDVFRITEEADYPQLHHELLDLFGTELRGLHARADVGP